MSGPDAATPQAGDERAQEAEQAAAREAARLFARPWRFMMSAPHLRVLPPEGPPEIAFAGRSNVGKSSLLNALLGQKGLARASNTPGRTQELNFFVPDLEVEVPPIAFVDMPGYGYAKAPKDKVAAWTRLVFAYLRGRSSLRRVVLLVDARHGIKPGDIEAMDALDKAAVNYQIVLTKADKIGPAAVPHVVEATRAAISRRPGAHPSIIATSAETRLGIEDLRLMLAALTG